MTRLSHSQRHEIAKAYADGESPTSIGRRYGIGCTHVVIIAKRAGIAAHRPQRVKPKVAEPRKIVAAPPAPKPKPVAPIRPEHVGSGQRHGSGYTKLM